MFSFEAFYNLNEEQKIALKAVCVHVCVFFFLLFFFWHFFLSNIYTCILYIHVYIYAVI